MICSIVYGTMYRIAYLSAHDYVLLMCIARGNNNNNNVSGSHLKRNVHVADELP